MATPPFIRSLPGLAAKNSPRLAQFAGFGSNPGNLDAWCFMPEQAGEEKLPLVVVLHGCTQTARGYDQGSGWSALSEAYGFAVLFPEQKRSNNATLCFNWFEPGDTRRGLGEAASIAQMVQALIVQHSIDPQRVFITGLSAGGAMTSSMLATYPELFAGGAILAGLPHGAAASMQEAFQQMRSPSPSRKSSSNAIKTASRHAGPWPVISVWHGTEDAVVHPTNADAIVQQWLQVHGISDTAAIREMVDGHQHRVWRNAVGKLLVEEYSVAGMGHGTPLDTTGDCCCGETGAFMIEAGISSTVHSAKSWGLLKTRRSHKLPDQALVAAGREVRKTGHGGQVHATKSRDMPARDRLTHIIENALRAAGLMK